MLSKKFQGLVIILIAFFLAPLAQAHHSFAVHFVALLVRIQYEIEHGMQIDAREV